MKHQFIISLIIVGFFIQCKPKTSVELTNKIDPDLVLINIEEGDRAFIGNLLLKIDSCKPILIGIDVWFIKEKDLNQDSILIYALKTVNNDILAYALDSNGNLLRSHEKFTPFISDQGLSIPDKVNGLVSHITPIITIGNTTHEQFPLKIIKQWKPNFKSNIKVDESIPIKFTRTLDQFIHFNGSEFNKIDPFILKNKIILMGYLGPSNEDKHFTPIRHTKEYPATEPDTYGLVMIANEIRTILDYKK